MKINSRIFVAGHRGLAGSAVVRKLEEQGYRNLVLRSHAELNLIDSIAVRRFFEQERPEYVFIAAAKVGGILANNTFPAEFIFENLSIQTNVIHEAWRSGVNRLLFLGSSCIYPRECPQPIKEEYLLTGPLEPTNRPYALAKIAGIEQCWSYNRQYSTRFLAAMPTNLYGPGDSYDLENSHVLPALIRKVHEAKMDGRAEFLVWGTGQPVREFLFSNDMANACVFLMDLGDPDFSRLANSNHCPLINIGYGVGLTIADLAKMVCEVVEYQGRIVFDNSKPDGMPWKVLDSARLLQLGWKPEVTLRDGIAAAYADYIGRLT